jgi:hypothetical protein
VKIRTECSDTLNSLEGDELLSTIDGVACLRRDLLHEQWLIQRLTQTTLGRVCPPTPPGQARAEIREGTRKHHLCAIGKQMHIDRTDEIAVAGEAAGAACPISAFGLVFVSTSGTSATCSSFGAGEAQDAGLFCFVGQIVDILSVLPQRDALIVMPACITVAHAMRIANEEASYLVLDAEVNDLSGRFVPQITHPSVCPSADRVLCPLQLLPPTRVLRATGLLSGELAQLLRPLPLEAANAPSCDNHRASRIGTHRGQVDFAQVDCRLFLSWCMLCLWNFYADMQLKATIPDQGTGTGSFRQFYRQDEGFSPFAHRQHHSPALSRDRLGRPVNRGEAFRPPRVFHAHLGMGLAQHAGRVDVREEGAEDRLNRLAMQATGYVAGAHSCADHNTHSRPAPLPSGPFSIVERARKKGGRVDRL